MPSPAEIAASLSPNMQRRLCQAARSQYGTVLDDRTSPSLVERGLAEYEIPGAKWTCTITDLGRAVAVELETKR